MARFEREAKVLASLNHPNIAAIYGLEESDAVHFLVLELVPGETLAQRIARGGLSIEEALEIASQIADALDEAHERGIVHRDLKPANVKITPEGRVKVLDFGLAKALVEEGTDTESSNSPTLTRDATRAGVILGTAAYMSPEQARGKSVDKRSDIFSFGCVLYEMLAGRKAFDGEEVSDILASVLKSEPDFDALPPDLHPRLRELLRRCLRKSSTERRRDIGDVRVEIREALFDENETPLVPPPSRPSAWWEKVGIALVSGVIFGLAVWFLRPQPPRPLTRFHVTLPDDQELAVRARNGLAVSPDGRRIAYVANDQIYVRSLDALDAVPVRGTENGGATPFFSPDGEWIGFHDGAALQKISVDGGVPIALCESAPPSGARWEADGTIVYAQLASGIWRVSENGGEPEVVVGPDSENPRAYFTPALLPGGRALLFTAGSLGQVVVQDLDSGEQQVVVERGLGARYLPTGHLVYFDAGSLFAIAFDVDQLEVRGGPLPVVEDVAVSSAQSVAIPHFDASRSGTLAYLPSSFVRPQRLGWRDRNGVLLAKDAVLGNFASRSSISPDGALIATARGADNAQDVWLYGVERGTWTRLTFDGTSYRPIWTPDGARLIYSSADGLFGLPADGSAAPERLTRASVTQHADTISPDGRWLIYHEHGPSASDDVWLLDLEGVEEPRAAFGSEFREAGLEFSPDGHWLAYDSMESGQWEIYVRPFSGAGRFQISQGGGTGAHWVRQEELFYNNGGAIVAVALETSPSFSAGTPQVLFESADRDFMVTRDGQRFMMMEPDEDARSLQQINVVLNWHDELKRLVPAE